MILSQEIASKLKENTPDIAALLDRSVNSLLFEPINAYDAEVYAEYVLDRSWEKLHTGHWKDVQPLWKELYSYASLLKAIALLKQASQECKTTRNLKIRKSVATVDFGLVLGSSLREELTYAAFRISSCAVADELDDKDNGNLLNSMKVEELRPVRSKPLREIECPSIEYFYKHCFNTQTPAKLTGCIKHWPALTKWNLKYINEQIGTRTVPIEVGSNYLDEEWTQKMMTVSKFIKNYIINKDGSNGKGYLAQHQLFNQIPELLDDIREPEYCSLRENDEEAEVDVNSWFGPCNTVTPIHYDSRHNLLTQVFGSKRVLLYSPEYSDCLYPLDIPMLSNTSQVDPENPDIKFTKFKEAMALECILNPGDMLYIPPRWWHHVRSLSLSFSVSFWWGPIH